MSVTRIDEFMTSIGARGGMSLTTQYEVEFDFGDKFLNVEIENFYNGNKHFVNMLCDEAQLPNVQSGVAQITGRHLGEGPISYPHTRIFTDLSLGFQLDAKATPLKFFTAWYDFIYHEDTVRNETKKSNRVNRLRYMDDYTCDVKIVKTEMPTTNRPFGETAISVDGILSAETATTSSRKSVTYILENCYPYSIDSVPLSYGSSQITRATVNFYYTRHHIVYEK